MIYVTIQEKDGRIQLLSAKGHADAAPAGQDLVCAGVSCIITGGQNALYKQFPGCLKQVNKAGNATMEVINWNEDLQRALEFMEIQLCTVQEQFPDFIKLTRKEV